MKRNYGIRPWHLVLVSGVAFAAAFFTIVSFKVLATSESEDKNSGVVSSPAAAHSRPLPIAALGEQIETEVITILPTGFQPTQITRPRGKFLLAVENRSRIQTIDFQLNAESGARILKVIRSWERSDWSEVLNPPPGRYVLREVNHPAWQCVITITQ